jgi:hypothetical protein
MGGFMQIETYEMIAKRYASDPLFSSAHSALVFAFNFSMAYYDRPLMNKMADDPRPIGKGLSGLDGAAQAGFVRAELRNIGAIGEAILTARIAPRSTPCECHRACCAGQIPSIEWTNAIDVLVQPAMGALSGCISHYRLRQAIVRKHFGDRVSLSDAAEKCGANKNTATEHNQRILKALKTAESAAWGRLETKLIELGIVEFKNNS